MYETLLRKNKSTGRLFGPRKSLKNSVLSISPCKLSRYLLLEIAKAQNWHKQSTTLRSREKRCFGNIYEYQISVRFQNVALYCLSDISWQRLRSRILKGTYSVGLPTTYSLTKFCRISCSSSSFFRTVRELSVRIV